MSAKNCLNCDFKLKDAKFCPNCGQDVKEQRYSFHNLFHDLNHAILHINRGFAYTFLELLRWPGKTCRGYISGKRVRLTMPFLYLFVTVGFLTLASHFFPLQVYDMPNNFTLLTEIEYYMVQNSKLSFSLAFLVSALVSYLMYVQEKLNYIEHCLINAYIAGEIAMLTLLAYPLFYFFSGTMYLSHLAFGHLIFLQIIYPAWVFYRCFNVETKKSYKFTYAFICSLIGTLLFTFLELMIHKIYNE